MEKALSRAALPVALISMLLLQVADRNSLEGGSLKVRVEGGVGTMAF